MEMVCIACPNGCRLNIEKKDDGALVITGNKCPKGVAFASEELLAPKRSVTTTVRTIFPSYPVAPVRTNGEIPKDKIFDFIKETQKIVLDRPYAFQEPVIKDLFGLGIDVICSVDMNRIFKNQSNSEKFENLRGTLKKTTN